jgi:phytoene synthase
VSKEQQIFKNGSTTYYFSSKFFPKPIREDVFKLYSFVRIADDLVDSVPQDKKSFTKLESAWKEILKKGTISKKLPSDIKLAVTNMYFVHNKYHFDPEWTVAFLKVMKADLSHKKYNSLEQTIDYMYGSAEVIGLMMSAILGLPKESYKYAKMQGRAMQYINFIRDISEDIELGRQYLPKKELEKYGLPELSYRAAIKYPAAYREFIDAQLNYYNKWQSEANKGLKYIPLLQRVPLRTAIDMYNWTAQKIAEDPTIVFRKKVKPTKFIVIRRALFRILYG